MLLSQLKKFLIKYLTGVIFLFVLLINPWTWRLVGGNLVIFLLLLITTFFFISSYFKFNKIFSDKKIILFLTIVILLIQLQTTNFKAQFEINDFQKIEQLRKLNLYPRNLARFAYWIEMKKETQIIKQVYSNVFDIFNMKYFFTEYFLPSFLPFFVAGIFFYLRKLTRIDALIWFILLAVNSLIGIKNVFGPFSLYPFIVSFITIGSISFFKKYL